MSLFPPDISNDLKYPLCIDLEGALTLAEPTHESILRFCAVAPSALISVPRWICQGRAKFKKEVAARGAINAELLPLRSDLVDLLKVQSALGRKLILTSAADESIAQGVANHLGIFSEIIASNGQTAIESETKRNVLVQRFGERGFDYIGNDSPVWASSRQVFIVSSAKAARAALHCRNVSVFLVQKPSLTSWFHAARVHQWVKNLLIFLPAALAHKIFDVATLLAAIEAFLAFNFCASSVYLLNDLLDLTSDRFHPRKRNRPFASGQLSVKSGVGVAAVFLCCAYIIASKINLYFLGSLTAYYVLTWAYSVRLKRAAIVDVMTLAALYTLRIIAGAAATSIEPSFWLLAFSMFMFISLGCVKRYTELGDNNPAAAPVKSHGRGYWGSDLPLLLNLGISSGFCATLVIALYLNSPESQVLYRHAKPLWLMCPVMLYWTTRTWLLTVRGQMHDDPVVFALRDRISLIVLILAGTIFFLSI